MDQVCNAKAKDDGCLKPLDPSLTKDALVDFGVLRGTEAARITASHP